MTSIIEDKKVIPAPRSVGSQDLAASNAFALEQHARIRANIRARGMTFEVSLPEPLAKLAARKNRRRCKRRRQGSRLPRSPRSPLTLRTPIDGETGAF
jgi:hypothetical protein